MSIQVGEDKFPFPVFLNQNTTHVDVILLVGDQNDYELNSKNPVSVIITADAGFVDVSGFIEQVATGIRKTAIADRCNENIYVEEVLGPSEISWYMYREKDSMPRNQLLTKIILDWDSKTKQYYFVDLNTEMTKTERALILGYL